MVGAVAEMLTMILRAPRDRLAYRGFNRRRTMTRVARLLTVVFPLLSLSVGVVWHGSASAQTVLHEYFEYVPEAGGSGGLPELPAPGAMTSPLGVPEEAPSTAGLTLTGGGPVPHDNFFDEALGGFHNGPSTPAGDATLDAMTEAEGVLRYDAVFTPTVAPWKRGSARNSVAVRADELAIRVRPAALRRVSIGGSPAFDADRFSAELSVHARAGEPIPIPSVAPDMLVHRLETSPPAGATITRDSADNYLLTIDRSGAFEVQMDVSASATYFGGALPANGSSLGPPLAPPEVVEMVAPLLSSIGVSSTDTDVEAARTLADYFRGFAPGTLPPPPADVSLYEHITLARTGVCRHRAQAFVISAAAIGLPARYVHNEAHAFVEVSLDGGWRRIDLGGAAEGMEVFGEGQASHQPDDDPFPATPPPYASSDVNGPPDTVGSGDSEEDGAHSEDGAPHDEVTEAQAADADGNAEPQAVDFTEHDEVAPPTRDAVPRAATSMTLTPPSGRTYRDQPVTLTGELRLENGPGLAERTVQVMAVHATTGNTVTTSAVTDARGHFEAAVTIPTTLSTGAWHIEARYAGDDETASAEAR